MGRPARIPDRGDVPTAVVARFLGLTVADFELCRAELEKRGFPEPDMTTGRYAIEAVTRWRLRRYPNLFPELTMSPTATHAEVVFRERMQRLSG
jgi:hypothetical protein